MGTKKASEGTRPSPPPVPCPASRRWHSSIKFLISWSLPIPASQLIAQALVGSEAGSPALWAVGDHQYLDMSQQRSHSTALHMRALMDSDRQQAPLGTASPTSRITPDPRLNTGQLTPWEGNILGRLNKGKCFCRPGRKSLDEICIAIFQTSWKRVQNKSLHWSSGA